MLRIACQEGHTETINILQMELGCCRAQLQNLKDGLKLQDSVDAKENVIVSVLGHVLGKLQAWLFQSNLDASLPPQVHQ